MSVPARTRWTDERIDDFAAEIHMLKAMPIRVATLTEQVTGMRREIDSMRGDLDDLGALIRKALDALDDAQADRRAADRAAAKSHRWHTKVASWANAAAVAIGAAVGALVSLLAGGSHP